MLLPLILLTLTACHRASLGPPPVAILGEDRILAPELKEELDRTRLESDAEARLDGPGFSAVRQAVLNEMVDHRLLLAEAKRSGLSVSDKELDAALAQRRAVALPGEPSPHALAPDELRRRTREQLLIDRFLLREVASRVAVGPNDAEQYYREHPDEFHRGEQIRVSQIVVPRRDTGDTAAMQQIQALRAQLLRGDDFAKTARLHSAAPEADRGGDLGWFARGTMPPEFDQACFPLRKGQISEVVESPYGLHLFKLVDRRDASVVAFAEARVPIEQKLQRAAVEKAETAYIEKLRDRVGVRIIETEVRKVL